MFFSATKHHIVFTFPGILCKWIFPDRSVAIENWCDATAATRTRPCSIWPYASELAVRLFVLLLLLSPVKCQTFCYFPNDCRQFLIVHWARGSTWGGGEYGWHAECEYIFRNDLYVPVRQNLFRIRMTSLEKQPNTSSAHPMNEWSRARPLLLFQRIIKIIYCF